MFALWVFLAWLPAQGQEPGCTATGELAHAPASLQLLQQNLRLGRVPLKAAEAVNANNLTNFLADSGPSLAGLAGFRGLRQILDGCSGWDCLKHYVDQPDADYSWSDSGVKLHGSVGDMPWTAALLQMTSQKWLPDEVTPSVWNHSLVVISPHNVSRTGWCLLYVALGYYGSSGATGAVDAVDPDVQAAAGIAVAAGIPAAVLFNVPAELLTFKSSSSKAPMVEDNLILAVSSDE